MQRPRNLASNNGLVCITVSETGRVTLVRHRGCSHELIIPEKRMALSKCLEPLTYRSVRKIMAQSSQAKAQTMRAVALDNFGGTEALKIQDLPVPQIEAHEVLIRVEAAGVGAWDPYEREGRFVEIMGTKPKFPYVLGTDGAGTIAAVGND